MFAGFALKEGLFSQQEGINTFSVNLLWYSMQAVLSSVNSYQSLCLIQESIFKLRLKLPKHLFATISPRSELLSASKASEFHQKRNPSLSLLQLPGEIWIQRRIDKSYGRDQTHCTPASQVYMGSTTVRANTFLPAFMLLLDNFWETVSWKFWGLQIQQCPELLTQMAQIK